MDTPLLAAKHGTRASPHLIASLVETLMHNLGYQGLKSMFSHYEKRYISYGQRDKSL